MSLQSQKELNILLTNTVLNYLYGSLAKKVDSWSKLSYILQDKMPSEFNCIKVKN